jgi:hypothetical protein
MNSEFGVCLEAVVTAPLATAPLVKEAVVSLTPGSAVPCLPYSGDILQGCVSEGVSEGVSEEGSEEVALWAEDRWTEERVREAQLRVEQQGAAVSEYWRKK